MNGNSRAADTSGGIRWNSGERELADSSGSTESGGEARGSDAAAPGTDSEEVEVVVAGGVDGVLGISADGEVAAGRGERKKSIGGGIGREGARKWDGFGEEESVTS